MRKRKHKYELVDNYTGATLCSGDSSGDGLQVAYRYILDHGLSYEDVSYVILSNGAKTRIAFRATGAALAELIEDELTAVESEEDGEAE
jgi:hypothetical protein